MGHSEINKYAEKVYHKRFPKSRCLGDIREVRWEEGQCDLLTGGFPCQPFSVAGKRRGKADDRSLWHEMFRAIREVHPTWILGENVTGIINMELEQVCLDLEGEGYEVQPFIIPACAIGAPHRRDRVWIVGYNDEYRNEREKRKISEEQKSKSTRSSRISPTDNDGGGLARTRTGEAEYDTAVCDTDAKNTDGSYWNEPWIEVAARLCRVDDGIRNRVERLRGLGNAIVPAIAEQIFRRIRDLELVRK